MYNSYATEFDAVNKIWSEKKIKFELDRHKNVGEILLEALASDPEKVVQVNSKLCLSMRTFYKNISTQRSMVIRMSH